MTRGRLAGVGIVVGALALAGCAGTKVRGSVVQSDRPKPEYGRVLVVAAAAQPQIRRAIEQTLCYHLVKNDVVAVSSWSFFPGKQPPRREDIEPKVKEYSVDAVLVLRLVDVKGELELTKDQIYDVKQFAFYGSIWTYYPVVYDEITAPEHLTGSVKVRVQSNLYDGVTGQLVWTATSETLNTRSGKGIESLSQAVVWRLKDDDMIR